MGVGISAILVWLVRLARRKIKADKLALELLRPKPLPALPKGQKRISKFFVRPNVIRHKSLDSFESGREENKPEGVKFKKFLKTILSTEHGDSVIFVFAQAGQGKTTLSQYLAYEIYLNEGEKAKVIIEPFFNKLSDMLEGLIKNISPDYRWLILDGLNEYPALLNSDDPKAVVKELFNRIDESPNHQKVIITTRLEAVDGIKSLLTQRMKGGENRITGIREPLHVNTFEIGPLKPNQSLKVFVHNHVRSEGDHKAKKKPLRKFMKSRPDAFANAFDSVHASTLLPVFEASKTPTPDQWESFHRIVNDRLDKAYDVYMDAWEHAPLKTEPQPIPKESFVNDLTSCLQDLAVKMVHEGTSYIHADQVRDMTLLSSAPLIQRTGDDTFRFLHARYFEFFVVEAFDRLTREEKSRILSGKNPLIDSKSAANYYSRKLSDGNFEEQKHLARRMSPSQLASAQELSFRAEPGLSIADACERFPMMSRLNLID